MFSIILKPFLSNRPGLRKVLADLSEEMDARTTCQRTRKELLKLDERQLRDIGITREDAIQESQKGYWD